MGEIGVVIDAEYFMVTCQEVEHLNRTAEAPFASSGFEDEATTLEDFAEFGDSATCFLRQTNAEPLH